MSPKKRAHIGRYSNASKKKKACIQEADSSAHDFEEQSLIQEDSTRSLEGLLLEEKRHKLEKRRRSQQIARQTEPQENRMERLQKNKERQRIARQTESQEKRTERLQKNKERQRIARQNETEVQRQQRLKKNRNRRATSRLQTICHEVPESNNGSIEQDRQQHSVQQTRTSERKQNHTQNNSSNKGLHNTAAQPPSPAADCGNDEDEDEGDDEMDGFEILRIKIEDLKSDGPEDEGPEDGMVKTRNIEPGSLVFMGLKEGARLMKKQDRAGRVTSTKETNEQKKRRWRRPRNTENSKETRRAQKSSLHQEFLHALQQNINTDEKPSSEDE